MEINGKRFLITGGCGFIGLNLIDHLQENFDCSITVLDNESTGSSKSLPTDVEFVYGDISDMRKCWEACFKVDIIVHLAAKTEVIASIAHPRADATVNIFGTMNLLEVAKLAQVSKFIHASSAGVIGNTAELPIHEDTPVNPISPYGISKFAAERYVLAYASLYGLNTMVLRFSNVYGPKSAQKGSVIPKFIKRILNDQPIEIYGDGTQTRDFLFSGDLTKAIVKAIEYEPSTPLTKNRLFQLATGKETSILDLIQILRTTSPKPVEVLFCPPLPGEILRNYSDISKAKSILGWEPYYDLEAGVSQVFEALKE